MICLPINSFFVYLLDAPRNKRVVISVDALNMHKLGHYTFQTAPELFLQVLEMPIRAINFFGKLM